MILVPLFDLKFLNEFAASGGGTSNRRHQSSSVTGRELAPSLRRDPFDTAHLSPRGADACDGASERLAYHRHVEGVGMHNRLVIDDNRHVTLPKHQVAAAHC